MKTQLKKKKKINSRAKGAKGELEIAHWLQSHGIIARRGQQFSGSPDSPDVVHSIPDIHIEVKRTETFSLYKAMDQAIHDMPDGSRPVVLHRTSGRPWVAVMLADDWIKLVKPPVVPENELI